MEEEIVVREDATEDQVKESDALEGSSGVQRCKLKEPVAPAQPDDATQAIYERDLAKFEENDIRAQLILFKSLGRGNSEMVNTCQSAKAIWDKLLSI
ncbi:hypothetical protein GE061_008498 [Apolygus lucorum]|uniref:Uncharacterized protein n=1 Tax=Apolygus lucorum TaxID=248454 RepID=A0A8S9WMJ9_APOLU|nr:hypothetical protein GE061_008498 [Apolygus lucorum]